MAFPQHRLRRLRSNPTLRRMVRQTRLSVDQLIFPMFVRPGNHIHNPIKSMPGQFQYSIDTLAHECKEVADLGIPAVLLFGIPEEKDAVGSQSARPDGVIQKAVSRIKVACPELMVITDVCLCEYTDHGHCGLITERGGNWVVDNDATVQLLVDQALSHVQAGADMVAPSDMMDGRVAAIRYGLDQAGFHHVPIMSYAAKYASSYYGPFREAAESPPKFGDRQSYQMDIANSDEALREVAVDVEEGADIVMVKPALHYLDIIWRVRQRFSLPVAAYHVSGEYSAIKAAAARGWLDEKAGVLESTLAIRRAGADLILTYFAKDLAQWIREGL
ncbi:MAG: porphobilinogen synthase [Phycisphaerales bacterium]|nr:porphobilinogen synthase [Phycisphaerales bacterium]